jgi:hypothetical protein
VGSPPLTDGLATTAMMLLLEFILNNVNLALCTHITSTKTELVRLIKHPTLTYMFSRQTVLEKHTACHLTIFHAQGESHMSLIIPTKPQNQVPKSNSPACRRRVWQLPDFELPHW